MARSKFVNELREIRKMFDVEKIQLLNHVKMIEYLFNKPTRKIEYLDEILIDYEDTVRCVMLDPGDEEYITTAFTKLCSLFNDYSEKYVAGLSKYLPTYDDLGKEERSIDKILDNLALSINYKLYHLPRWSFYQKGKEDLALVEKKYVRLPRLRCHFYGILINNDGKLSQFVIEYDSDRHFDTGAIKFPNIHINDIIKQYYLFQLSVHILRLRKHSDFEREIKHFLDSLIKTNEYVSMHPIRANALLFNHVKNSKIVAFNKDYRYDHLLYLRMTPRKDEPRCIDDPTTYHHYTIDDPSESFVVTSADKRKVDKNKSRISKAFNNRIMDDVIVQLVRRKS